MNEYTTGNARVDQMGQIRITGNVTPQVWYKTITRKNGKPHLLAIAILSDIVYWYRPVEIRDESTGHITGYGKRFKWDMLQRSYDQFADFFGESKRSITEAVTLLESLGIIRREFRTIEIGGMKYNNILFIDLFPEQLRRITYPETEEEEATVSVPDTEACTPCPGIPGEGSQNSGNDGTLSQDSGGGDTEACTPCPGIPGEGSQNSGNDGTLSQDSGGGDTEACTPCPGIPGEGSQNSGTRNTKNTTENTTEITSSSSADDDRRQEMVRECRAAALEGGCAPELADAVASELHRYDRLLSLSPPAFLDLCRNISDHASGDIANMSAYIRKCMANMVLSQKLSEAKAAHRIRADSTFLQEGYGVTDWEAFERNILSN